MDHPRLRVAALLLFTVAALAADMAPAIAQPTAMCVRQATGVPGAGGVPQDWFLGLGPSAPGTPDDPRWVGASGHSVSGLGAAADPVELRTTWGNVGGRDYLYLSWQFFVDPSPGATHVLHLLFTPPGQGLDSPDARVVRLRFRGDDQQQPIAFCDRPFGTDSPCGDDIVGTDAGVTTPQAIYTTYRRLFEDEELADGGVGPVPQPGACPGGTGFAQGARFEGLEGAAGQLPWLAESARYWNDGQRWTVQLRIPIATELRDLRMGLDEGAGIAYQASLNLTGASDAFHRWPPSSSSPARQLVCDSGADPDDVTVDPALTSWRRVHLIGGGPIAADPTAVECGGGIYLDSTDIGVLGAGGVIGDELSPSSANTLVACVHNPADSAGDVATGAMTARWRIANWGVSVPDVERWIDVPIVEGGTLVAPEAANTGPITRGGSHDITRTWTLTPLQACQYTVDRPGAWATTCEYCNSDGGPTDRVRVKGTDECAAPRQFHQCIAVELRGGGVDFDRRGTARNMNFSGLSSDDEVATLDLAGLTPEPTQTEWEVFLVAMPRNLPRTVPAGTTGTSLIVDRARAELLRFRTTARVPISPRVPVRPPVRFTPLLRRITFPRAGFSRLKLPLPDLPDLPGPRLDDFRGLPDDVRTTVIQLQRIATIPRDKVISAERLTKALVQTFDGPAVAQLVPTLDVYAYVRVGSSARGLLPLSSFVLFGHHEGELIGMRAGIDGAEQVSERVYRVRVPVGGTRQIRPWMQALTPGEPERHNDPTFGNPTPPPSIDGGIASGPAPDCVETPSGCCRRGKRCPPRTSLELLGETLPFGVAAVFAGARRRRRRRKDGQAGPAGRD